MADDGAFPKDEAKQVALWQERIKIARKQLDQTSERKGWRRYIREYEGEYPIFLGRIKAPPINEVFSYVQSTVANLSFKDPYITVVPKKTGTVRGAAIREAWINYQWRELKTKEEVDLEIMDKEIVGHSWHKTGTTVDSIGTGEKLKILSQKLYSMRVSWQDMCFNVGSRRPPLDCQWMAQRIIRPLEDIKAKYPAAREMSGSIHPYLMNANDYQNIVFKDDIKVGTMHEIWDARSRKIYLIGEGVFDKYLQKPRPWPDYLDEFPFNMFWDHAIPDSPYPLSSIAIQEPQILEKIVILSQAVNHVKRWNRQLLVKRGTITGEALDKFEKGIDGAIIEYEGQGSLKEGLQPLDYGQLPTDFYLILDRLDQIIRTTNGQPEFDRGGVTKTQTRTLGELQFIRAGAKSRTDRKIDRLETHLENIARHLMAHMQANMDIEQIVKVTGETPEAVIEAFREQFDPVTQTITFSPEDIQGEYDIQVKAGSTLPMDKQTRMQVLETVLQSLSQAATQGVNSPFIKELVTEILKDFELKGLEEAFQKEQEMASQAAEQQAQEGNMEKAKTAAEAHKREAQADQIELENVITEQQFIQPLKMQAALGQGIPVINGAENGV